MTLEQFRSEVQAVCRSGEEHIIVSYSRKVCPLERVTCLPCGPRVRPRRHRTLLLRLVVIIATTCRSLSSARDAFSPNPRSSRLQPATHLAGQGRIAKLAE